MNDNLFPLQVEGLDEVERLCAGLLRPENEPLLPFDCARRFAGDVVYHPVNAGHFVDYAV